MSNNTLPPSVHRQEWWAIITVVILTFLITNGVLIYFTWDLYTAWGSFEQHFSAFVSGLKEAASSQSTYKWQFYWQKIVDNGWKIDFFLHMGIPSAISIIIAWLIGNSFYYPGGIDQLRHVSGPKLYSYKSAIKHAKRKLKSECNDFNKKGLELHPEVAITKPRESGNIFVGGAQGTGKTLFITPLVEQVIARGERAFIYDEKREFTKLFFDSSSSILIAPWDSRGHAWNISADAKNATQAELIAEHLVNDTDDPLWSTGAKMILAGLIEILNHTKKNWG